MPPEQREEILNELRLLLKWNTIKYLSYQAIQLCESLKQKRMEVSDLSGIVFNKQGYEA